MSMPDPRLYPYRDDLAAERLRRIVKAPRYAQGEWRRVLHASAPLRRRRDVAAAYESELVFGELFEVFEFGDGWAWGQAGRDGYVGYLQAGALGPPGPPATHRVSALRSFVYPVADIKVTPLLHVPFGAEVALLAREGDFMRTPAGWLFAAHLAPIEALAADPVAVAERFIGIPYLWGGKSTLGLDCSGLVQTACYACGIAAPRDSDLQEACLGEKIARPERAEDFQRGDLLFWPGHVALAQGEGCLLHANAHFMAVTSEALGPALARIAAKGAPLRQVRRLPPASA